MRGQSEMPADFTIVLGAVILGWVLAFIVVNAFTCGAGC